MTLIGHDEPWHEWRGAMAGTRMHHGWILAGKKGLGKASFAVAAARELVATPGVPQPEFHPDIVMLEPLPANDDEEKKKAEGKPFATKRNISIDQVRAMQHRLETRPTLGDRRVVIIDPADDLEKNAVNALLKSLEEPPRGTFFLLVSHRPGRLLPTIRSRCRTLRFPSLPDSEVADILGRHAAHADAGTRAAAVAAGEGSAGAALGFVEQELGELHAIMLRIVSEGDDYFALRGALAAEIGARPDRERQLATLDLARAVLEGVGFALADGIDSAKVHLRDVIHSLNDPVSTAGATAVLTGNLAPRAFFPALGLTRKQLGARIVKDRPVEQRTVCCYTTNGVDPVETDPYVASGAGIVVGVVTLTGLGLKFSSIVIAYAGGSLLLTAIYTSLIVWVIGLAVPVTASYIICAVIAAPALTKLGVPDFAAHMFIFYYAVLSEVSPPTALSPFAAAAITGGDPYKTTLQCWKYTVPAFLLPFMFVLDPSGQGLLLMGSLIGRS